MRYTLDANADYLRVVPNSGVVILGSAGQSVADISGGGLDNYGSPAFSGRPSSERYINPGASPAPLIIDGIKQNYVKADVPSHAGGALAFGPDGYLYVSIGDGTSANYADPRTPDVQNLNSLSGKVLRIDPMTGQGLTDNPFYQPGQSLDSNISKVYQYGFRHPFSMAFDDLGRLFVADVGWSTYEEINTGNPGANFGWPWYEGKEGGALNQTTGYRDFAAAPSFYQAVNNGTIQVTAPYAAFGHAASVPGYQNQVITSGPVIYDGDRYPAEFQDDFFFTSFDSGAVFTIDFNNRQDIKYIYTSGGEFAPVHFVQGPDGFVYYAQYFGAGFSPGSIGRLQILPLNTPTVTITAAPSVTEAPGAVANITFSLSAAQSHDVTITYHTVNGSATSGTDYVGSPSATVVIPAGQTSVVVPIAILNDATFEPLEAFSVVLDQAQLNGSFIPAFGSASVNIIDDDPPPPTQSVLVNGSFEQPSVGAGQFLGATSVPGWTAIPGGTIEIWNAHGGVMATNGANFLELDWASAHDGFFQDVQTIAGQAYTLQFDTRTRPNLSASTMGIEVLWNGALIATASPTGAWTTRSFTVTGTGGQDRLTIREVSSQSADGLGAMLDNFRLTANGPPNAPPVAGNDTATTNEDVAVAVAVLANDSDPEGQTLTVTHINGTAVAVGGSVDVGPAGVTRNANGTLTVTPDANYNGPVNFTYRVSDGVASADANVAVTVNPLNDAPVVAAPIADQSGVVNQAFSFQVAANAFTDVDNPSLTYSAQLVGGGALPGWLSFNPATRTFSGTPPGTGPLNIR